VKQYDGTAPPPAPPEGWREVWHVTGPRVEGPLLSPVAWWTTMMIWERAAPIREEAVPGRAGVRRAGPRGSRDSFHAIGPPGD